MPLQPGGQSSLDVQSWLDVRAGPGQPAGDILISVCLSTEVEQEADQTGVSWGRNLSAECENPSMTLARDLLL